jgi:hypothetical protein
MTFISLRPRCCRRASAPKKAARIWRAISWEVSPRLQAFGADTEVELRLAGGESVVDVRNLGIVAQSHGQIAARLFQDIRGTVRQFYGQGRARTRSAAIRFELEIFGTGDVPYALPPQGGELRRGQGALFGRGQKDPHRALVASGFAMPTWEYMPFDQFISPVFQGQLFGDADHAVDGCLGAGHRRAEGHGQFDIGVIRFDLGEHDDAHAPAGHVSHRRREYGQGHGQGQVAQADGQHEQGRDEAGDQLFEPGAEFGLGILQEGKPRFAAGFEMPEVGRQDKEALHQGDDENADNHRRQDAEDASQHSGHEEHGHEGHDIGQHGEGDGHDHLPGTSDGGLEG